MSIHVQEYIICHFKGGNRSITFTSSEIEKPFVIAIIQSTKVIQCIFLEYK